MKRYAKFGYDAPLRFRVLAEKPQVGAEMPPPPSGRRLSRRLMSCHMQIIKFC